MSVTINAKGTSLPYFKIGKNGVTLYQGSTDPSLSYAVNNGDVWFNTAALSTKVWSSSQSVWELPKLDDITISNGTISAGSQNLTLSTSADLTFNADTWPSISGTSGQLLATDGTGNLYWTSAGSVTSISGSGGTTGLTLSGGPITTSGTLTLGGTLAVTNGGTGATDSASALTNLGAAPSSASVYAKNALSTGVLTFTGITVTSTTTFSISAVTGYIVDNETNPASPVITNVNYAGATGLTTPYLTTNESTYVLVDSSSNIVLQGTPPTHQQKRQNIYLGRLVHPNKTTIVAASNRPFISYSPYSQIRGFLDPIGIINDGVIAYPNGSNLNFNVTAGNIHTLGGNFTNSVYDTVEIDIPASTPASFYYITQTTASTSTTTTIDPGKYDVNGTITTIPGNSNARASNQRIYLSNTGLYGVQYGQQLYGSLTEAIAGISSEIFIPFPSVKDNSVLIGILSVLHDATNLSNTSQARFLAASKFGEASSAAAGTSTTTLQGAYNNSTSTSIITNSTGGALVVQRGSAADTDTVFEVKNGAGTTTASINGNGVIVSSNLSGTNTGDQTITLTGDVTGSGTGSFATSLSDTSVTAGSYTNASLTIDSKGRITAASNGPAPVAGTTGQIQYNNSGSLAGTSDITTSGSALTFLTASASDTVPQMQSTSSPLYISANAGTANASNTLSISNTGTMLFPYSASLNASTSGIILSSKNNTSGPGYSVSLRAGTGTGTPGNAGGNGYIELIGGGGTSAWSTFSPLINTRRRGGVLLQAGRTPLDTDATYYTGSLIQLNGSAGTTNGTSAGTGSNISLSAGNGITISSQVTSGSSVFLNGGDSLSGGNVLLKAGNSSDNTATTAGGSINLFAGSSTLGTAGEVLILAGQSTVSGNAGPVKINAGNASGATGLAGDVLITAGQATTTADSGNISLITGPSSGSSEKVRITPYGSIYINNQSGSTGQILVSNGATQPPTWTNQGTKTTITGILKGNGTDITSATAGTDYVAPGVTTSYAATQSFNGTTSTIASRFLNTSNTVSIIASSPASTQVYYLNNGALQYYTSDATANWVLNITFSSGTTLNTAMNIGDSVNASLITSQGTTAYYPTSVQVDGTSLTVGTDIFWQGGSAPTAGSTSGKDVYNFTIIKTAASTFTVLATQVQY